MIPSAVAREARENQLEYLEATYDLSDPEFERALFEFLSGPDGLFRGPYLDVRLPFRQVSQDTTLPLEIAPPFRPYLHQMRAFERLHGQPGHGPQHSLVTTGTGSGKTECFLYPVLDHCWRERQRGARGIKAILIYPMNALATDQARRLAKALWDDPRLKGQVTAGLYVGGKGLHKVADREHLIDDRKILRQAPPDILLTNYKMLDFLLLRPEDQVLWKGNAPTTLRFLVLDELHTYDGAQGSDVACLIRRLKARLGTPEGGLCCVGTSATIGDGDEIGKERLTRFAHEIFAEEFSSDSVITEDRLGIEEALGRQHDLETHPDADALPELNPRLKDPEAWLARQKELWLGEGASALTRVEVGERLEQHDFLHQLLRALSGRVQAVGDLAEKLAIREEWFGALDDDARLLVLDSFIAVVSHARRLSEPDEQGQQREEPFLAVQVQLWLREVSNLLRAVDAVPQFQWRSEMGGRLVHREEKEGLRYLPTVRCRECGCAGLASIQHEGEARLRDDTEEREIGRAWMKHDARSCFVAFGHGGAVVGQAAFKEYLCPRCLRVGVNPVCECEGVSTPAGLPVRVARELSRDAHPKFRPICPECGAEDSLVFLGSRASSLLSVAVSHLFQTGFNADRKLLAFVDSVQDASHRAGFFGARTYRFNLRTLTQGMLQSQGGRVPLAGVGERLLSHAEQERGLRAAIPVLVPEDLREHPDYERFLQRDGRGMHSELREWLVERLSLEVTFEYGFSVRSGRSLEKVGCSTIEVDRTLLEQVAHEVAMIVSEEGLLESQAGPLADQDVQHFLSGLLNRLRLRGGIHQSLLARYVGHGGNRYFLTKKMNPLGAVFGPESVLPRFLLEQPARQGQRSVFDAFAVRADRLTWYRDWASRSLGLARDDDGITSLYRAALDRLVAARILAAVETNDHRIVWGLDPEGLTLVDGARKLSCPECREVICLPTEVADKWAGRTCTQYRCAGKWGDPTEVPESFYTRIFRSGRIAPVFPEEHTGLLSREKRERIEEQFKSGNAPDAPNLLACTPTLEMGIDIGDLSAVMLCSVPPTTSNYLQRVGRAGRSTGNALCLTMANGRPHDLYFHADPPAMMAGAVDPPGCFLNAPEMLKRQVVAHAMDAWARQETEITEIPSNTTAVLAEGAKFPRRFLEYYAEHKHELLADFLDRFDRESLSEASRHELEVYALSDRVAESVHLAFDEIRRERARLKQLQAVARKRVEELDANPDKAQVDAKLERDEAVTSHKMLGRLIVALGKRYPLNVLTDAGVLPNYAFPEPGVELDSVIRSDDKGNRHYEAHQYLRPASAAIKELAPFNLFYAEGRRVRVDEIDLGTPAHPLIESWRLCAACNHAERDEGLSNPVATCPSCGDPHWVDVDQRRQLVYFRRSRSLATRLEAASADEGEERQRTSYQTHDLIDVGHENLCGARLIEELPFGFELLSRLVLREVNFGPDSDVAASFNAAGMPFNADGFRVCRDCGRVRPENPNEPIEHAPTCRSRKNKAVCIDSVYLYREVTSDAIRLLLPVGELDLQTQQASFRAALQLGMRRHFHGLAPNLQIKAMREPIRGGGHRQYLVIFDAVPGGTGFLADLWREDALVDMLADALAALKACSCLTEGKDGCYRCLFAYQNQRDMEFTSSETARRLLEGILAKRAQLKDVDTLSDVVLDSKLESELEERFLRSLVARAKHRGSAKKLLKEGDERWELVINDVRWEVRPQVQLGPTQGVEVPCQPDFLIVPVSRGGDPRSIAVFCDGLAYHVQPEAATSRLGDDVEKRRAILTSGKFLVWSVTWKDIDDFDAGKSKSFTGLLDVGHSKPGQAVIREWGISADTTRGGQNSMELLWGWLCSPSDAEWLTCLAAVGADFVVRRETLESHAILALESSLMGEAEPAGTCVEEITVGPEAKSLGHLEKRFAVILLARLGLDAVQGKQPRVPIWTLRLYDDHVRRQDAQFQESWRAFLQAVNLLQFADGFSFGSTEDLARREASGADIHPLPRPAKSWSEAAETAFVDGSHTDPLAELDLLDDERKLVETIVAAGGPLPHVGFELEDATGRCVAEAQLAWPDERVAVLIDGDAADTRAFVQAGWRVFTAVDDPESLVVAVCPARAPEEQN